MEVPLDDSVTPWNELLASERVALLSDLDGTLVPFAPTPADAVLDEETISVLGELAALGVQIVVVSGRPRKLVDHCRALVPGAWWFAEHGTWRSVDGPWMCASTSAGALGDLGQALLRAVGLTDGARLERKTAGVCVHWRQVPEPLRDDLIAAVEHAIAVWLRSHPDYERLPGVQMVEVRQRGLHKGRAVDWVRERLPGVPIVAMGDDVTDDDMFAALSAGDVAVSVGRPLDGGSRPHVSVADVASARGFLRWLAEARSARAATVPPRPAGSVEAAGHAASPRLVDGRVARRRH
jgi:trehalose-phosphatase